MNYRRRSLDYAADFGVGYEGVREDDFILEIVNKALKRGKEGLT